MVDGKKKVIGRSRSVFARNPNEVSANERPTKTGEKKMAKGRTIRGKAGDYAKRKVRRNYPFLPPRVLVAFGYNFCGGEEKKFPVVI